MFVAMETKPLKVAILDLYEGQANEGMRCLRNILLEFSEQHNIEIERKENRRTIIEIRVFIPRFYS